MSCGFSFLLRLQGGEVTVVEKKGTVTGISGPVVTAASERSVAMFEVARVGRDRLLGEVIRVERECVRVQVYEDTTGLCVGDEVLFEGGLLSVDLGPGLLGGVFDGIGRPLRPLGRQGVYLPKGAHLDSIGDERAYPFTPMVHPGQSLSSGDFIGSVRENAFFTHHVMMPPEESPGVVAWVAPEGEYGPRADLVQTEDGRAFSMVHRWRLRVPRPLARRLPFEVPLLSGQRVLDTLFPIPLGGAAVLPGGFGTGKTVTQQSLAKWCSADVIVYIGCGERGNEMTEVLEEFPELLDPATGGPLMDRTVLVANTSNMPVAAREASIYLGMTIGEYFRDMGHNVAIMADSTSRWAEALREISGRLEEMPGEEGYPAYLGSRLAQYYERAGRCVPLGAPDRTGSVTVVNAVSPAGGDFSEPVTQTSLRLSGAFWALDKALAQQRHFPAINWRQSYTLYEDMLAPWFRRRLGDEWFDLKSYVRELMEREQSLLALVQLVGRDGLSEEDTWTLAMAEFVRILYLQQNAFSPEDATYSLERQRTFLDLLRRVDELVRRALSKGALYEQVEDLPIQEELLRLRARDAEAMESEGAKWFSRLETLLLRREEAVS
ncbi:MAG TPA: V-type ATP synthase subunit A [Synergistaceae bacterium]|nr:V-type ATP synthase subunit A [Synergistaceae bacterium]